MFSRLPLRCIAPVVAFVLLVSVGAAKSRTWVDRTGKHRVEAEFVKVADGQVTLRRDDGREVTLALSRLSPKDQAYIKSLQRSGAKSPIPVSKSAAAKRAAKEFYYSLLEDDRAKLRAHLTSNAQAKFDASAELFDQLDKPNNRRSVLASRATIEEDTAEVLVTIRTKARSKRNTLHLRLENGKWLVTGVQPQNEELIEFDDGSDTSDRAEPEDDPADDADGSEDRNADDDAADPAEDADDDSFEDDGSEVEDDEDSAVDSLADNESADGDQDDVFRVPDGTVEELKEYIAGLKKIPPPRVTQRQEIIEFQNKLLTAMLAASEKIINSDASESDIAQAIMTKMTALAVLGRTSQDPEITRKLERLPDELEQQGHERLARDAKVLLLEHRASTAKNGDELQLAVNNVRNHLKTAGPLTQREIALAQGVARLSERFGPQLAAEVYEELGQQLSTIREAASVAELMLGTARRMNLVGNEMFIEGVTADDAQFDASRYKGKVVLVDFWATWCGPCIAEMPNIRKNYDEYHDRGFEVVAISIDRDLNALKTYIGRESPPWTVLVDRHPNNTRSMSQYYGVSSIPTTILVGEDGKVVSLNVRGSRLGDELKRLLGSK